MAPGLAPQALHAGQRLLARVIGGAFGKLDTVPFSQPARGEFKRGELKLSYLRWPGDGPALVLLHGLSANAWMWARVAMLFHAAGREVLALDQRGHGGSSAPETGYGLPATTHDLRFALDRLTRGPVDLAGHSWGGKVVCHLAATAGDRVRRVVLADPVMPQGFNPLLRRFPRVIRAAFKPERGPFPDRASFEDAATRILYLQAGDAVSGYLWRESFDEQPDGSFRHRLPESAFIEILEEAVATDITALIPSIEAPVLLMLPTLSVNFWPGETGPLRRALGTLEIRKIPGDHSFIQTNPLDTHAAMRPFLGP